MVYNVGADFIKIEEISGTIRNMSTECTLEMSTTPEAGSGVFVYPNCSQSFRYHEIYLRCIDGTAEVDCTPYDLNAKGVGTGNKFVADGTFLHLTFDFPTGSNKTMLLPNPRPDLSQDDIDKFSEYVIEHNIFRNNFAEPTLGIKRAMLIQSLLRSKGGSSSSDSQTPSGDGDTEYWQGGQIEEDDGNVLTVQYDTRRKLARDAEFLVDLRRRFATDQTLFTVDLRRRVKWRWLTRILPDSSFLDPKIYAAADALDDQITLFHWAIKNVLHLPRLGELKGTMLDLLAWQFHVDAYDAINFTDETKRELIRTSIAWHRIKGTPAAVEMVLAVAFANARIEEWFDYGGDPYYFRLYIKGTAYSPGSFQSFWRMFWDAKNVRSHLDRVIQDLSPDEPIKIYTGIAKIVSGVKTVKARQLESRKTYGVIFTGAARYRAGTVTTKTRFQRPTTARGNIFAGGITIYAGRKIVGMYKAT